MRVLFTLLCLTVLSTNLCFADSDELSKQATAFYSDNNYNKTMELLLQIDEKERTAKDWLLLGNLMDEKGEKDNAVFMYQKALNTNPKYYRAYYNIGNIYLEQERYSMAVDNYKKALRITQTNPYIYCNLASAYIKQGRLKDAKKALIKAVTIKNNIPELQYNLAYVYKKLGNNKLAQTYLDNYNKLVDSQESF